MIRHLHKQRGNVRLTAKLEQVKQLFQIELASMGGTKTWPVRKIDLRLPLNKSWMLILPRDQGLDPEIQCVAVTIRRQAVEDIKTKAWRWNTFRFCLRHERIPQRWFEREIHRWSQFR